MGQKAKAKRAALGSAYIGKHGTKLRQKRRQQKNRARKETALTFVVGSGDVFADLGIERRPR